LLVIGGLVPGLRFAFGKFGFRRFFHGDSFAVHYISHSKFNKIEDLNMLMRIEYKTTCLVALFVCLQVSCVRRLVSSEEQTKPAESSVPLVDGPESFLEEHEYDARKSDDAPPTKK
jgi:hypothetical protein